MNLPTTYVGGVAYVARNASLKTIAERVKRRPADEKRWRGGGAVAARQKASGPKRGSSAQGARHGDLLGRRIGAEATSTQSTCLSVFGGSRCISHPLSRGRHGIEALTATRAALGFSGIRRALPPPSLPDGGTS